MSNGDIPGFYRDPKTGKLFREKPFEDNPSLKKIKLDRTNEQASTQAKQFKLRNVLTYLRHREYGGSFGLDSIIDYHKTRASSRTLLDSSDLNHSSNNVTDVDYIKSGSCSIFGLWRTSNMMYPYALGEVSDLNKEPQLFPEFLKYNGFIQDMSEIFPDTLIYVQNDYGESGTINLLRRDDDSGPSSYLSFTHVFPLHQPLYCCTAAYLNFIRIVVGGVNNIFLYKEFTPLKKYNVEGRTMTVTFDDTKNLIISGQSTGHIYMHDLRTDVPVFVSLIETGQNKCLVDSYFLPPDKIFITGVNNKLVSFDIRAQKPVAEFLGHKHSVKKHALSFSNDLLCVNGADNVVRLWHNSGGLPVNEIYPSDPRKQIRGCLKGDGNITRLFCFEGSKKNIYQL